jgi:glycosyltransferase involved in cell wall biosynthesis
VVKKISFVIPTLNEERGICLTIQSIPQIELKKKGYTVEVLVVDGGSTDKTVALARKAGATVIEGPRGYGKQYQLGLGKAGGHYCNGRW